MCAMLVSRSMVEATVGSLQSTMARMPPDALAQVDGLGAVIRVLVEGEGYEWTEENARLMLLGIILVKSRLAGLVQNGEHMLPLGAVLDETACALSPALLGRAGDPGKDYLVELEYMAAFQRPPSASGVWAGLGRTVARALGLRSPSE